MGNVFRSVLAAARAILQQKTVTAGTSNINVTPDSGYDGLSSVTVQPTPSQSKSASPSTSAQTISPDAGKLLSSVAISAIQTQTKSSAPNVSTNKDVTPDSGKYLSKVTITPLSHTGTYTPAANTAANDMGEYHDKRYVNTSGMVVPSGTYSAGTYTTNGTKTISGLRDYIAVTFDVEVPAGSTTTGSFNNSDTGTVSSKTQTFNAAKTGYRLIGAAMKKAQVYSAYINDTVVNWQATVSVSGNTITLTMKSNNTRTFRCNSSFCQITAFYVSE